MTTFQLSPDPSQTLSEHPTHAHARPLTMERDQLELFRDLNQGLYRKDSGLFFWRFTVITTGREVGKRFKKSMRTKDVHEARRVRDALRDILISLGLKIANSPEDDEEGED